uniref:Uncharacterized protein n=1 Tax=Lepeophtheirus salmonis TaxID=72036 RepID=A0A0K2V9G9_LEPSM
MWGISCMPRISQAFKRCTNIICIVSIFELEYASISTSLQY